MPELISDVATEGAGSGNRRLISRARRKAASEGKTARLLDKPAVAVAFLNEMTTFNHRPRWWRDQEIAEAAVRYYGRLGLIDAQSLIAIKFGDERAPGVATLGRLWQRIDGALSVQP